MLESRAIDRRLEPWSGLTKVSMLESRAIDRRFRRSGLTKVSVLESRAIGLS